MQVQRHSSTRITDPRYAIFYSPERNHPLSKAASEWLLYGLPAGDSTRSSHAVPFRATLVDKPRRYGFHATLKAPFRLGAGRTKEQLEEAIERFTMARRPVPLGSLTFAVVRGALALVPNNDGHWLRAFASTVVENFDEFRRQMDEGELQRRLSGGLGDEETLHLVDIAYLEDHLRRQMGDLLNEDFRIDALTLFEQDNPHVDFIPARRFPMTGEFK